MMKKTIIILFLLFSLTGNSQDQLKVMTYNILNYGNITSYCTASNNPLAQKEQLLRKVLNYIKPDVVVFNELASNSYVQQRLLDSCFNYQGQAWYQKAGYSNAAGSDIVVMAYYDSRKLVLHSQFVLNTSVRDIMLYRFYYNDPQLNQTHDTAFINIIGAHLKAGSSASDASVRATMTLNAMNWLNSHTGTDNNLFMGDLNLKTSSEQAYQNLINYSNTALRFYDPVNQSGNWNNNYSFRHYHTQSTHTSSNGCASGGGLDDRFDLILASQAVMQGTGHYAIVANTYTTVGNDGNHFNQDIKYSGNTSAPSDIINALYDLSDHLPVTLTLQVDQNGAGLQQAFNPLNLQLKAANPFDRHLKISLSLSSPSLIKFSLFDAAGKIINTVSFRAVSGQNSMKIPTANLPRGFYYLRLSDDTGYTVSRKLIKL